MKQIVVYTPDRPGYTGEVVPVPEAVALYHFFMERNYEVEYIDDYFKRGFYPVSSVVYVPLRGAYNEFFPFIHEDTVLKFPGSKVGYFSLEKPYKGSENLKGDFFIWGWNANELLGGLLNSVGPHLKSIPDYSTFLLDYTRIPHRYSTYPILGSFGCSYQCEFCVRNKVSYSVRNPEDVIRELKLLKSVWETKFSFWDNDIFLTECNSGLLTRIKSLDMDFDAVASVRYYNKEFIELTSVAYEAGLKHLGLGVESLNSVVLSSVSKKQDVGNTLVNIASLEGSSFYSYAFLIYGLPRQTFDSVLQDISRCLTKLDGITLNPLRLTPGVCLAEKYGEGCITNEFMEVLQTSYMSSQETGILSKFSGAFNMVNYLELTRET